MIKFIWVLFFKCENKLYLSPSSREHIVKIFHPSRQNTFMSFELIRIFTSQRHITKTAECRAIKLYFSRIVLCIVEIINNSVFKPENLKFTWWADDYRSEYQTKKPWVSHITFRRSKSKSIAKRNILGSMKKKTYLKFCKILLRLSIAANEAARDKFLIGSPVSRNLEFEIFDQFNRRATAIFNNCTVQTSNIWAKQEYPIGEPKTPLNSKRGRKLAV